MIQSMTAFSQVQFQADAVVLSWECRSLNHRYLDVTFRLPESLRHLEANLRQCLRGKITRGKLDFQLKITEAVFGHSSMMVNAQQVEALLHAAQSLASAHCLANDVTLSYVLSWPGVIDHKPIVSDDVAPMVETLFQEGLEKLLDGKRAEGAALEKQIHTRLHELQQEIIVVREHASTMISSARKKLMHRLNELQMKVLDERLEQEVALALLRSDVSEELDRLDAHLNEIARILEVEACSGKRLDFLMQELNREANTLSSKSDSVLQSQRAVHMKVLIEQMREQIQNVE